MKTVSQRIAYATSMVGSRALSGWCEKFVRQAFGFPARYSSALKAWNATKHRHGDINNAPAGVPIFWRLHPANPNYGLGHVALSVGGGYCISTSVGPGRSIGKVGIATLTRSWGMTPLGWTEDYHGRRVHTPAKPAPARPGSRRSGRVPHTKITVTADGVFGRYTAEALQKLLRDAGHRGHAIDGQFGPASVRSLQQFLRDRGQRGHAIDGVWGPATTRSLQAWLRGLGYTGHAIDGVRGQHTITSLQLALIDGKVYRK